MELKVGVIGLGARGASLLRDVICKQACVTAVCDLYEDRVAAAVKIVEDAGYKTPLATTDYREVIDCEEVNTVIIITAWESHVDIALYSMEKGKPVAMEVGGAYTVKQCWDLVDAYERTRTPFMFLENCCFGRREMMVLNMVQKGLFGEIVHAAGGYHHDLRTEVANGIENRHYRLRNYLTRNCENYPTHELGPIAKVLNINHGNRLLTLTSTSSKSAGLHDYIMKKKPEDRLANAKFAQGDIVTTVIKCANGETVVLTLDTTLPRYYSRGFTIRGTNGMYEEATDSVFLDREEDIANDFGWRTSCGGNAAGYEEEYDHPTWKQYLAEGVQGTHDGMDWLEFKIFFDCLKNNLPMPVDVYDAAVLMCITPLSEMSVSRGGAPVDIPDFTRGKWIFDAEK